MIVVVVAYMINATVDIKEMARVELAYLAFYFIQSYFLCPMIRQKKPI